MKRWFPFVLAASFAAWFVSTLAPQEQGAFDIESFSKVPLVYNGRHQPLDSFARNSLVQIRQRRWHYDRAAKKSVRAAEWLAEVMFKPDHAASQESFRVDNQDLKQQLKLPGRNIDQGENRTYYSWNELSTDENIRQLVEAAGRAGKKDASQRDAYDQAVLKLASAMTLYQTLQNVGRPSGLVNFEAELTGIRNQLPPHATAVQTLQTRYPDGKIDPSNNDPLLHAVSHLITQIGQETNRLPLLIPPAGGVPWMRMPQRLLALTGSDPVPAAALAWAKIGDAYAAGDAAKFNEAVGAYSKWCGENVPRDSAKCAQEVFFNRAEFFYKAMTIYVAALILALSFWFTFSEWVRQSAFLLSLVAFAIHLTGLVYRMVLEGRPPVTNLYSSAIFIGLGAIVLGLFLERIWKNAIGLVVGSMIGFTTLVIAHNLALEGDTMEMMRAVLDTNFWLATHVVVVTLGYSSTFVAGMLAVIYVLRGVFTSGLDSATRQALARMVYGIVCFATLFSFTGTVLGGIWADQSWGRFWGWDPKENGALIIVLWNALILHARWGGMVRERGIMNLAIAGNIVTAWSWFGVNMLGIGLHSYGFTSGAFVSLAGFAGSQVFLMIACSLPLRLWRSPMTGTAGPVKPSSKPPAGPGGKPQPVAA
jgi:ABC-type transport system involved in cytochrome c biogenesis permease subunit